MAMTKRAFVTGSARGIGLAICERLARDGFSVVGADIVGADNVAALKPLNIEGRKVTAIQLDICDRGAVATAIDEAGPIDALVNNAGIFTSRGFFDLVEDDFRRMFEVNVIGSFVVAQEAARRMKPGSRIVNIASRAALGNSDYAHYVASKAAVVGLTKAMALDLRDRQIAVNAVAPGFIETRLTQSVLSPELQKKALALQPGGGGAASPSVIADAVAFLASADTKFINGQTLFVDNGKSIGVLGV